MKKNCQNCSYYKLEFIKGTLKQVPFCNLHKKFLYGDASWFCDDSYMIREDD